MVRVYSDSELDDFAAFYDEHGAVRLPGLIEPDTVSEILDTIGEVRKRVDEPRAPGETPFFFAAPGKLTINRMWTEQSAVRDLVLREELARPIARIARSKQLRFWFDLTFIHEIGPEGDAGDGTPWHHDIAAFGFKGEQLPSLWMALTPTNAERSRLLFVDGSHRDTPYFRPPLQRDGEPPKDGHTDVPDVDALVESGEAKILTWDCEPGDAIVIHPFTIHGAKGNKNAGAGRRVAITTRWLGDDIRWIPTTYGGARPRAEEADIPVGGKPSGSAFPLVWDRRI